MFAIIRKWPVWVVISLIGIIVGQALFWTQMRLSIDFTGGIKTVFTTSASQDELTRGITAVVDANPSWKMSAADASVETDGAMATALFVVDTESAEITSNDIVQGLIKGGVIATKDNLQETSNIGASIGAYMKKSAFTSLIAGLICIALYTLFAFSGVRRYISPGLLAGVTLYTLLFDVSMVCGAYGLFMMLNSGIRIDSIFVVAVLTIIGYSINDTLIIFDRIRENARGVFGHEDETDDPVALAQQQAKGAKKKKKTKKHHVPTMTYHEMFETSVWQVMKRSIGTSLSTLVAVIAMAVFGNDVMRVFAYTLMAGVIAGTYSSIFVAAPLAYKFNAKE